MTTPRLATLAVLGASAALAAQPAVGDPVPEFKIAASIQDGPRRMGDLEGRAVLIDLFATW